MIDISEQPNEIKNIVPGPYSLTIETLSPSTAAHLLERRRPGGLINEAAIAHCREAMRRGRWVLNGMPIIVSSTGVLLDGVQRLHACIAEARPLQSVVARGVADEVLPTIDQHSRRSAKEILAARGVAYPQALTALLTRLIHYDDKLAGRAHAAPPSWLRMEDVLRAIPDIEDLVAESLAMAGSPLPEAIRTAILCIGAQHSKARTLRLLEAVWRPHRFDLGEPGAALRVELDREAAATHRPPAARERIFAMALLALRATLDGATLRQITWHDGAEAGQPRDPLPDLRGGWSLAAPPDQDSQPEERPETPLPRLSLETIGPAAAADYLRNSPPAVELRKAHLDALTRDILAQRWQANPQPICFCASGRLVNGRHRLMAVIAAQRSIALAVVRGVPEGAYATYDLHHKRAPLVGMTGRTFGDEALVAAMANLLWREERRRPNNHARTATTAEIQQILLDHPRLRELRGLARRMVGLARASVIGYAAFVVERDDPRAAPAFLRGLETGADLPRDHPILALRAALLRMRAEDASQERQLAALLDGWRRFKLYLATVPGGQQPGGRPRHGTDLPRPPTVPPGRSPTSGTASLRSGLAIRVAGNDGGQASAPGNPGGVPPKPASDAPAAPAIAELERRKRQQALTAGFGRFVMGRPSEQEMMEEAARVAAIGLGSPYSKVLQYDPTTSSLLLRAGMGWPPETIGHARFDLGHGSPAGFAFTSGRAIFSERIEADQRFALPPLLKAHGIIRQVNVVIGREDSPFGVLEVNDSAPGRYVGADVSFLAALANSLGLALERARDSAERDRLLLGRDAAPTDLRHRVRDSLQLVQTILTLHANDAKDEAARKVLESSARQISTIGMVAERVYWTEGWEAEELGRFLTGLVAALREGLSGLAEGRSVAVDAASTSIWPARLAELLGIVTAELLTNALRFGRGAVHVRFLDGPPAARLEVISDDHAPPPGAADEHAGASGLRIAAALLREQGGALTLHHTGQAFLAVAEFPWPDPPRSPIAMDRVTARA